MMTPEDTARAACAGPEHLAVVDAAYERPGGPEAQWMKKHLCRRCPVAAACLDEAVVSGQRYGVWGATSSKARVQRLKVAS